MGQKRSSDTPGGFDEYCQNEISLSEWKEALNVCRPNDPGHTTLELASLLNISPITANRRIRSGLNNKTIKKGYSTRIDRLGTIRIVPVYQIINKGKK